MVDKGANRPVDDRTGGPSESRLPSEHRDGIVINLVDTFALVDRAVADPASFGLTDVKDPCLSPGKPVAVRHPKPVHVLGRLPPDRS